MESKLALVEVFRSLQGEGYNAGRPAIFVRLAGCNLSCVFADGALCDTPYQRANIKCTVDELFEEGVLPLVGDEPLAPRSMNRVENERRLMLVVTGGEPTLSPLFVNLVSRAREEGFYVALETNGTRYRSRGFSFCDWVSCSPKVLTPQGSPSPLHNPNPLDPTLADGVIGYLASARMVAGEYRYVIGSRDEEAPIYRPAFRHYVTPAALSDGSGMEWKGGFPGYAPGALARCLEIVQGDPRWRLSVQVHKYLGQR